MNNDLKKLDDIDPVETKEWVESLKAVLDTDDNERAHFLLEQLLSTARQAGLDIPFSANTAYINTIPTELQPISRVITLSNEPYDPTSAGTP